MILEILYGNDYGVLVLNNSETDRNGIHVGYFSYLSHYSIGV